MDVERGPADFLSMGPEREGHLFLGFLLPLILKVERSTSNVSGESCTAKVAAMEDRGSRGTVTREETESRGSGKVTELVF